jgi:hypothetical protein
MKKELSDYVQKRGFHWWFKVVVSDGALEVAVILT